MIFSYEDWANYRGLSAGAQEFKTQFDILMPAVQEQIENYIGYELEYATHTEILDGTDSHFITLTNIPVYSVSGITANSQPVGLDDITIEKKTGNVYYAQGLLFNYFPGGSVFTNGIGNITASYTAGYTSGVTAGIDQIPAQIKYAAWTLLDSKLNNRGVDYRVASQAQGNENFSFRNGSVIDEEVRSLLRPFRKTI